MNLLVCAIYDSGTKAFQQPFFCRTKAEAIRSFSDAVGSKETPFCRHPEDYVLFELGVYDDNSGELVSNKQPDKLITALECVGDGPSVR